ncbi:MAG: cytochrome c3 family protein [Myxococcales bacterium]
MKHALLTALIVSGLAGLVGVALAKDPDRGKAAAAASRHNSITEGLDCANCHTPAGWNMAGGKKGEGFDHSRTGFPLTGRHQPVACNGCHRGERRVKRECNSCHEDPHQSRLSSRCDSCHSSRRWNDIEVFQVHRRTRFPLTGMHALAACTECHLRNGERQWTTVQSNCFACHANDYLDPNVHPDHRGTATTAPFSQDCSQCHTATAWSPAFIDPTALAASSMAAVRSGLGGMAIPADHDRSFPISRGPHRGAPCNSCHSSAQTPRFVRCTGCHAHNAIVLRKQHKQHISSSPSACLGCHPGGTAR